MPLQLLEGDLVRMPADAIVNAANTSLACGSGVCGAIFQAAGLQAMQDACRAIGGCEVGRAVITPGFLLPAKYVIHAVGPIWQGGQANEAALLASAYRSSLALAAERGLASIAFPLISSGAYGYPREQAMQVAVDTLGDSSSTNPNLSIFLVLYAPQA